VQGLIKKLQVDRLDAYGSWPSSVEVRIKLLAGNRTPSGVRRLEFGRHLERLVGRSRYAEEDQTLAARRIV
jgi:hypothetical protein